MNIGWMTHLENLIERKRNFENNESQLIKKKKLNERNCYTRNNSYQKNYSLNKYNIPKKILENYRKENINELYQWQEECLTELKKVKWDEAENFIYVAPTSGGKSLVAEIFAFEEFERTESIFFLFPLNSLINEKVDYFKKICKDTDIKIGSDMEKNKIILCTYEKLNNYLNKKKINSNNNFIVIIDEFHLINEKPRGIYIENIISKILYLNENLAKIKIMCMSGTLNNIPILAKWMKSKIYISSYRPQEIKEHYICNYNIFKKEKENFSYLCNIYDFSKLYNNNDSNNNDNNNKYNKDNKNKDNNNKDDNNIDNNNNYEKNNNNASNSFIQFNAKNIISSFLINKNKVLNNSLIQTLLYFSMHSLDNQLNTLIFCSTKKNCEIYINVINQFLNAYIFYTPEDIQIKRKKLNEKIFLIDKYAYNKMNKLINNGICYYYSDINISIKKLLEISFKEKILFLLTCTSTLSVGLNLLVDRVIISSPFIAQNFLTVTQYKQMVGRAARLKKGDSIILVEKEHEKKLLEIFNEDFTNIKSTINDSLEALEKYIIEFICLFNHTISFHDIIHSLSFSLYYNEVINSVHVEEKKEFLLNVSAEEEKRREPNFNELYEINIKLFTEEELFFYNKKKEEIHKVINNLLKHKCIEIKNKNFQIANFCRSLCISNFTLTYGVELLEEIKNYDKICLYNNFHLCYLCSSYNINITSFNYELQFLKNIISVITDNYTKNIIFQILKFDSDIINVLTLKNQNIFNKKKLFFNDNLLEKKYCKLYMSILLYMYLQKFDISFICSTFKITEDSLQSILQNTYIHIHILIAFFDQVDEWMIASLLKKFLQYFKNSKSLSIHCDFPQITNLKYTNNFQKKKIQKKSVI